MPVQQAHWKWGTNNPVLVHSIFDYWFEQIKLPQFDQWVSSTNIGLISRRYRATHRGELLRYLGVRLASVLERRRGGIDSYFETRVGSSKDTIFEGGDYENRFGMSKTRFRELTTNLRFAAPAPNTVDQV